MRTYLIMIRITQLLSWSLLLVVQRVAGSHLGITRVLPVEGGLTDFRVGPAPSPSQPPSTAPPPPQSPSPAPVREEAAVPESAVRFPNNLDFELGDSLVRGVPSYLATSNAQGYPSRPTLHVLRTGTGTTGPQMNTAIDSVTSASENAYREGEYLEEDINTPSLIGGQTDSEVTFRYEHHPSIFVKNPSFNSVAIGFMVYLILLTLLQNSMLNWSQKGALLTLGATTQRNQREAVDHAKPISYPHVSTTTPATRNVDNRAHIQLQSETPKTTEKTNDNRSHRRSPVSVKDILNSDPDVSAAVIAKSQTAGPRTTALTDREHSA